MRKYLFAAVFVLSAALCVSIKSCADRAAENRRLAGNQRTLFEQAGYYRTKDSLSAASVERLELTKKELEKYNADLVRTCDGLRIKVKRLQSASTTATETKYTIETNVRDSTVIRDSLVVDTLRCITYHSLWFDFAGCMDEDRFGAEMESRDTLVQIVHRVPRKFLFFRWGTKAIRQEVISKNPHSRITYSEYLELRK